ncbi:UDP-N-acetylmuramoyl-L-alanine--D-glutamate ligase, partial [Candidatus Poribacteria bacterium]|nr:UDP-N-acetylmuramoyl-L-alanine--D-glutamate ligase [Candidatus Poribacteria bacterium]
CIEKADRIVVSPGVPLDVPILLEARAKGIPIVGELEVAASLCPAPIVAITGTKGKSTTTTLTALILQGRRLTGRSGNVRKVCIAGNIGVPLSSEVQNLMADDLVVVEVSSFQLETTFTFRPAVSVVLNLSRDHLDRHRTMEAYRAAKLKICANQTPADWIVLNAEDAVVAGFAKETQAKAVYFTTSPPPPASPRPSPQACGEGEGGEGIYVQDGQVFANWGGSSHCILATADIPLLGRHNLQNVLAATAVGQIFDIPSDSMRVAIRRFTPAEYPALEHAFELVKTIQGVRFINDSKATNVAAVKAALESLSEPILLIMGGYDKGNDYEPLVELVKTKVKGLILLGTHTQIIRNALAPHVVTWHAHTMEEAVKITYASATRGDVVLLSPANASFDMFSDYKARGLAFREAVRNLQICK